MDHKKIKRIMLINDNYIAGGSELQIQREMKILLKKGYDVLLLTFDGELIDGKVSEHHFNIKPEPLIKRKIFRYLNDLRIDHKFIKSVNNIVRSYDPDFIHLNNINYKAISIYSSLGEYTCVQTIRDCRAFCPVGYGIDWCGKVCSGIKTRKCYKECMPGTRMRDKINNYLLYKLSMKMLLLRARNIKKVIAPGNYIVDLAKSSGLDASQIPDVLLNKEFNFDANYLNSEKKTFLFIGRICEAKGISVLLRAFSAFAKRCSAQLVIAGQIDEGFSDKFYKELEKCGSCKYVGNVDHEKISELIDMAYCVVVPSIVVENYPNTVIEAYARKRLVIGTDRGGIKQLIGDDQFMFNINDEQSVIDKFEYVYNIPKAEYIRLSEDNFKRIYDECNEEAYYNRLFNCI